MKITFLRSVIVTRAIHSAMAGHSNTLFELVSLYLSWISWCPSYFLQNICLLACYAEIWDPSREKVQETQPLKLNPTAAINFNLQPKHLPNGQLELIFLTYCTGKMHGHGIFEFFWRLVWCVVPIYSSDRESPICRWRRPARPHSWCAGKEFKLYVSRGQWTPHTGYRQYINMDKTLLQQPSFSQPQSCCCSHTVITRRQFIKRAQVSVVVL